MRKTSDVVYDHEGNQSLRFGVQLKEIKKTLEFRVLSREDWRFWITWGYVVVPDAVPSAQIERLRRLLWEFQEMDEADKSTWDKSEFRAKRGTELSGMVEIYHHQYLWDNRQYQRVYDAFVDIWDREDLWVTIDRAYLNTPDPGARGFIHWDVDTSLTPLPVNVQGVLALSDTDLATGGFQCVPELFREFEQWKLTQPWTRNPYQPDTTGFEIRFVPMRVGDLLIFNSLLAHGIRPNHSARRARLAQYISMYPADSNNEAVRQERIRLWSERESPKGPAFPGDQRQWEKTRYPRAELTTLGKRLLGIEPWPIRLERSGENRRLEDIL